jgi:hypothetical protein
MLLCSLFPVSNRLNQFCRPEPAPSLKCVAIAFFPEGGARVGRRSRRPCSTRFGERLSRLPVRFRAESTGGADNGRCGEIAAETRWLPPRTYPYPPNPHSPSAEGVRGRSRTRDPRRGHPCPRWCATSPCQPARGGSAPLSPSQRGKRLGDRGGCGAATVGPRQPSRETYPYQPICTGARGGAPVGGTVWWEVVGPYWHESCVRLAREHVVPD